AVYDQLADVGRMMTYSKRVSRAWYETAANELLTKHGTITLLFSTRLEPDHASWGEYEARVGRELLAMETAQQLGVPTVNGYSSFAPAGWGNSRRFADLVQWCEIVCDLHRKELPRAKRQNKREAFR